MMSRYVAERVSFPSTSGPRLAGLIAHPEGPARGWGASAHRPPPRTPRPAGLIDHPEGPVRGWGVFAHGFTLGKDSPAASRICKQLAAEGVGMLRFDNLGLGDSEGDWGDGSFSHKVADTVQAV